jgi:hypothetical protein
MLHSLVKGRRGLVQYTLIHNLITTIPNCLPESPPIPVTISCTIEMTEYWIKNHINMDEGVQSAVGFDIEWRPTFQRGEYNKTAIIQLATPSAALIIHIQRLNRVPTLLREIFNSRNILKVGVGVKEDLKRLRTDYQIKSQGYNDIAHTAQRFHPDLSNSFMGLSRLYEYYFGVKVVKSRHLTMGNWERDLTLPQIQYASWDSLMGIQIYNKQKSLGSFDKPAIESLAETCASKLTVGSISAYKQIHKSTLEVFHFIMKYVINRHLCIVHFYSQTACGSIYTGNWR